MQQALDELVDIHEYVEFTWEGQVIYDVRRHPCDQPSCRVADEPSSDGHSECDGERSGIAAAPRAPRSLCRHEPEKEGKPVISDHFTVIYPPNSKNGLLVWTEEMDNGGGWLPENPARDWKVIESENSDTVVYSAKLHLSISVAYLGL